MKYTLLYMSNMNDFIFRQKNDIDLYMSNNTVQTLT